MAITLEHQAFDTAVNDLRGAAAVLSETRRQIGRDVDALLATWQGLAADAFSEGWADWQVAAGDVLEGLLAMERLLDAAHADLTSTDLGSQAHLDHISALISARTTARLVGRLG